MKATIAKSSHSYFTWIYIFASDTIQVLGPPYSDRYGRPLILVDVSALNIVQLQRLVTKFARRKKIPSDRMAKEIISSGSAEISAEGVSLVEEAGLF